MVLKQSPASPGAHTLVGLAQRCVNAGRLAEALPFLRQAVRTNPTNAAVQHDLGCICLQVGLLSEAVTAFEAALAANPRFALASLRLGVTRQTQGDVVAALTAYRRATVLLPSLTEARFRTGALLETLGVREEAVAVFRRAAISDRRTSLGRLCDVRALLAEDRDVEAERAVRRLLALHPGDAVATDLLGTLLANSGRFDEARSCYDRAARAAPHLAGSYYDLVRCRPVTATDRGLIDRMQVAVAAPTVPVEARLKVHLALGKAADDLEDPATAMRHFGAAETLRNSLGSFDPTSIEARVDRLVERFTPDLVARAAELGSKDPAPVLVLGIPRSGTTLVEQILACHPDVHACGELPFWTARGSLWEQTCLEDVEASFIGKIAGDYIRLLRKVAPMAARVTDKMPLNVFWAGLIHLALPHATIIHCRRRAIDTALSIHRTYLNQHVAFPTGGTALVAAIQAIERLAAHWRAVLPADRFVEIDYEHLVSQPEPAIRDLLVSCGLPWHDPCLRPETNPRIVKTPSKWQVRQPIRPISEDAWRRFAPWLGELAALAPRDASLVCGYAVRSDARADLAGGRPS